MQEGFAAALGRIPSGIFILTVRRGDEEAALLASWVQQASFDPPTVSLAVHKDRPMQGFLAEHALFAINILGEGEQDLYKKFVKGVAPGKDIFSGVKLGERPSGAIFLAGAHAAMECRVRQRVDVGDHFLIVADVLDGCVLSEDRPRVHIRKSGLSY